MPRRALAVLAAAASDTGMAMTLSRRLDVPLLDYDTDLVIVDGLDVVLIVDGASLKLQRTGASAPGPVAVDFGSAAMRYRRRSGANELLGRAVGVGKKSPLRVLDATAGLGRDSFVLADLDCVITLCERDPVLVELLRSGMAAAACTSDAWLEGVVSRMQLMYVDACELQAASLADIDVIYLDPMFPQRARKSAAVSKEMALFQFMLGIEECAEEADGMLAWALAQSVSRVVVKRPPKAPALGQIQPSHCISGKAVRYDVYVRRKLA